MRIMKKTQTARMFVFLLLTTLALAPPPALTQEKKQELEHQISVSAISIAVTVQDRDGRYISDLEQKDFTVYENEVKQSATYFTHAFEAPVSLTVLLDVSGSMAL